MIHIYQNPQNDNGLDFLCRSRREQMRKMRLKIIKFFLPEFSLLFPVGGGLIKHAPRCLVLKLLHLVKVENLRGYNSQFFFQNA